MTEPLQTGDAIGPYRIAAELGRGGMGAVYRAVHRELGHEVALKVILPADAGDEESRRRFQREATAAARLKDEPGIVGVRDYGEDGDRLWFAMPYVRARTLEFEIDAGDLSPARAAGLLAQAARAVHRAHAHGIIHRDLKPANILVDEAGDVWVNDFGLVRFTSAEGDAEVSKLTRTGFFVGTPNYMAPEQIGGKGLDARADVYGLGATLYDALTGRPPFEGDTLAVTLTLVMRAPAPAPSRSNATVPEALDAITLRCLAKDPQDRYASALEVAEDLERFVAGLDVKATTPGLLTVARRSAARHRNWWGWAALALAGAATFAVSAWWFSERTLDTEQAITQAQQTRTAAERAQALLDVWAELNRRTTDPIRALQDRLFGVHTEEADLQAALAAVRSAVDEVQKTHPESHLPEAWYGLALVLADRASEGIQKIDAAMRASDNPLCDVVLARAHCARFLSQLRPVAMTISEESVTGSALGLTEEMTQDLRSARHILAGAKEHPLWAELGPGTAVVRYERAMHSLLAVDTSATPDPGLLTPLQDEPLLADETALLEGFTFFRGNDPRAAADAWLRPAHRRWPGAMRHAVVALLITGRMKTRAAAERLRALDEAAKVLELFDTETMGPEELATHHSDRGLVHWIRSDTVPVGDPSIPGLLDEAARAFDAALRARPGHPPTLANAGVVLQARARRPGVPVAKATEYLQNALQYFDLVAAQPGAGGADHARAATARVDLSRQVAAAGGDPRPMLRQAVDGFEAALQAPHADTARLLTLKASVLHELGKAMQARGEAPLLVYMQAARLHNKAIAAGSNSRFGRIEAANLSNSLALITRDPVKKEQYLLQAQKGASLVLKALPDDTQALQLRGMVRRNLAETAVARRRDPLPLLRGAEEDYSRAIDAQPGLPAPWEGRGLARYKMGVIAAATGGNGVPHLERAIADFDAALSCAPNFASAMHGRAMCRAALAEIEALAGRNPLPFWDRALQDADAAVGLAPRQAVIRFFRGKAYYDRALAKIAQRIDPAADLQVGYGEFRAATELAPRDWRGPFLQGMCLDKLGRRDEALAQFEAAAKLDPRQPLVRQALAQLRAAKERDGK